LNQLDFDVVVNVQGDEPFMKSEPLKQLLDVFLGEQGKQVQVASMMRRSFNKENANNPNCVKVVVDNQMNSLLFSRSPIPFYRDLEIDKSYFEHIGVYAYRKEVLLKFTTWPQTPLEKAEKLEQLRYIENGIQLKMVVVDYHGVGIDTPEDLVAARALL
jgi:3-deoxy-D-manno-octulosonate cytidylyltransferase